MRDVKGYPIKGYGRERVRRKRSVRPKNVVVKRSSAGLGLFAAHPFKKGERIIEYFGRTITNAEAYTSRSKYLFEVNARKTVDGTARANIARYINHSCKPNCEPEIEHGRIYIDALKNIKAGEELAYNYGDEYFGEHIKPRGCRCVKHHAPKMKPPR